MALHYRAIFKTLGVIALLLALFFVVPIVASIILGDGEVTTFVASAATAIGIGLLLWYPQRGSREPIRRRDIYVIVTGAWVLVSLLGMLPFLFGHVLSPVDAFFETVSGFTTTGATVIEDIEATSPSILLWRSLTQWIGGMGIVVLMIAIIPLLGVGGMQLFDAESPGPMIDRLKPRVKETALIMWIVYASLTVMAFVLFLFGGMSIFDSLAHAFSTLASGGFSTKQESLAAFAPFLQYVTIAFMFLTGINYALLYSSLRGRLAVFWRNEEFKAYLGIIVAATAIIAGYSFVLNGPSEDAFRTTLFTVVSMITGTGFTVTDYAIWAPLLLCIVAALMLVGGMTASTSGSVKVMRHVLLAKGMVLEFRKQVHPDAILPLRFNGMPVRESMLHRVMAFAILYLVIVLFGFFLLLLSGSDIATSFGAVAATLGNVGPGLGAVGPTGSYAFFGDGIKLFLSFLMIVGRLELFTVLILFTPYFWRKY